MNTLIKMKQGWTWAQLFIRNSCPPTVSSWSLKLLQFGTGGQQGANCTSQQNISHLHCNHSPHGLGHSRLELCPLVLASFTSYCTAYSSIDAILCSRPKTQGEPSASQVLQEFPTAARVQKC